MRGEVKVSLRRGVGIVALWAVLWFAILLSGCSAEPGVPDPSAATVGDPPKEDAVSVESNTAIFTSVSDFELGTHDGTRAVSFGNGALALQEGVGSGTYTSPVVNTKPFEYMILSWNADTPQGTYIEIEGRIHAGTESKQWSNWLSWGRWSTSTFVGQDGVKKLAGSGLSAETSDGIAKVATDELIVIGNSGETADKFQYRITLHAPEGGSVTPEAGPRVLLVASTIRNTLPGQEIPKIYAEGAPNLSKLDKDLDVPTYSQQVRYAKIASSICSPTSIAMVLGYHGIDISPEEAAWGVRDYQADMFGNWPFNTAYAAAHGLTAYVEYGTPAEGGDPWYAVKHEINNGNPVVVSVKYRKPGYEGRTEPEVEGVPINYTAGHLVLVRGFTWKDGSEYVIVNDPAAANNEEVRRLYPADQFFEAWVKKVMYVLRFDESEAAQACVGAPIQGELVAVDDPSKGYQKYELRVDGNPVDLSTKNLRSAVVSFNGEKTTPFSPREAVLKESNFLWFKDDSAPGMYTFWFFDMDKRTYQAEINWKQ